MTDINETPVAPAKQQIRFDLYCDGNKIGEFSNEMEMAMSVAKYISFNKQDNTAVKIINDGKETMYMDYWALKLPELFIFASRALADFNVIAAQIQSLQKQINELKGEKPEVIPA